MRPGASNRDPATRPLGLGEIFARPIAPTVRHFRRLEGSRPDAPALQRASAGREAGALLEVERVTPHGGPPVEESVL